MDRCAQIRQRYYILILAMLLTISQSPFTGASFGQQVTFHGDRKLISQLKPVYPPLARNLKLTGTVKIVAIVAADGHVLQTQLLGGNPLLAEAANQAIAKAKWQAHSTETKELIEVRFQANDQ